MELASQKVGPPLPHILEEELDEEIILFNTQSQMLVTLNESAADVWRLCTGSYTMDEVVQRIAGFYGVESESVRDGVEAAVEQLVAADLIAQVKER